MKVISVRFHRLAVEKWLEEQKQPGRSINTVINEAIEEKMARDKKKVKK